MATMNISAAREKLPDAVELARTEAVFLERYRRPAAVLVSPEQYERLVTASEDAEDAAALDAATDEEGPNVPGKQVNADLGWTWASTELSCVPEPFALCASSTRRSVTASTAPLRCWRRTPVRPPRALCTTVQDASPRR